MSMRVTVGSPEVQKEPPEEALGKATSCGNPFFVRGQTHNSFNAHTLENLASECICAPLLENTNYTTYGFPFLPQKPASSGQT